MKAIAAGLGFIVRRLAEAMLVMLSILVIAFAVRASLGDPLREIVGEAVPEQQREALRHQLGLDAPWPVQLASYLGGALHGDLGTSTIYKRPTLDVVLAKFPASFELVLGASLIVLLLAVPLGIYCAVRPRAVPARLILGLSVLGISIPVFLTGILLMTIFSVWLGWLPAFGRGATVSIGPWESGLLTVDGLKHLILPALTLSSIMLPLFIRLVRGAAEGLVQPRAPQRSDSSGRYRRAANRHAGRLRAADRDGVPVAWHGLFVPRGGDPRRHPADHHLSRRRRPPIRHRQ